MKQTKNTIGTAVTIFFLLLCVAVPGVLASPHDGPIRDTSYAWGENIGWINFQAANGNIRVTDTKITGFAWSKNYGWINFSPTNGGVTNTCEGKLGGHAWSGSMGWIPFAGVTINAASKFTGMAGTAGSTAGRINFDCANCNVTTDWRQCSLRSTSLAATTPTPTPTPTPTATPTPTPIPFPAAPEEESIVPSQLFDIALIIDDPLVDDSRALSARVTFTSFGTEDTPVDMEFVVLDASGKERYTTTGKTVIQTEGIYNQAFADLIIPDGKYTLVLKTRYSGDIKDEFRATFEVKSRRHWLDVICNQAKWIIPLEFIMIGFLIIRRLRRKEIPHV